MKPFNGASLEAQPPRVEAGHKSRSGGRALWADVGLGKPHPILAELLHPRCLEARVVPRDLDISWASAKEGKFHLIPAQVICQNEDDMGRLLVSLNRAPLSTFATLPYFLLVRSREDE